MKSLGQTFRFGLFAVIKLHAKTGAITQQLFETRQILGRRNQTNVANAAFNQGGQRIIHHRLVINQLELLAGHQRQRIQP